MQTVTVPLPEWQALQRQLRESEGRQKDLTDALATMNASTARTIAELQEKIRHLEAQLEYHQQLQQQQQVQALSPRSKYGYVGESMEVDGMEVDGMDDAMPTLRTSWITPAFQASNNGPLQPPQPSVEPAIPSEARRSGAALGSRSFSPTASLNQKGADAGNSHTSLSMVRPVSPSRLSVNGRELFDANAGEYGLLVAAPQHVALKMLVGTGW